MTKDHSDTQSTASSVARSDGDSYATTSPLSDQLGELTRLLLTAQSMLERADSMGRELRDQGATWQQLADAAGITVQAAHQRWSPEGRRRHREGQQRRARTRRNELQNGVQ